MANELDIGRANGLLKVVYGKDLVNLAFSAAYLQNTYKVGTDTPLTGSYFAVPVVVRLPGGHSFNGTSGSVVSLNSPLAGRTVEAQVTPYEYVLREYVSYGLIDRAKNGGEQAFMSAAALEGKMMTESARNALELQALWGQLGLATVNGNISSHVITIDNDTFSAGILSYLEGQMVDVYQSDLATVRQAGLTISAVDTDAQTITFDGTATDTGITTGDVVFLAGANSSGTFGEMAGLAKQMVGANGSGTTGTFFNLNKATYSLWRSSVQTSIGEFSPSALVKAAVLVQNKNFMAGDMTCLVSPRAWGVLNSSLSVGEIFPGGFSMVRKTGADELQLNNGGVKITIVAHPFMKQGWYMVFAKDAVKRVGALDLTFSLPGKTDEYYQPVPGKNALERQARASWAIFLERPCHAVVGKGITYSS